MKLFIDTNIVIDVLARWPQFFSAMRSNADYLLTRNVKNFPHNEIPVLTPEEFLQLNLF